MDIKFKAQMMGMSPRLIDKTDPRRLQELMDARMIQEDENAMANCPTRPINREFHHSYVNPYDDHAAIGPVPPRNRKYSDAEDRKHMNADNEAGSYGARVESEW
jgi:hypothetical protein